MSGISCAGAVCALLGLAVATAGVAPGEGAAPDQTGRVRQLTELTGKQGAVVFEASPRARSAFCASRLTDFEATRDAFERVGVATVGLWQGTAAELQKALHGSALHYPVLLDANRTLAARLRKGSTVPAASLAAFALGARGRIETLYADADARVCPSARSILARRLGVTPDQKIHKISAKQMTATPLVSDVTVHPGERVALLLDLDLAAGLGVYGPASTANLPLSLDVPPTEAIAPQAAVYPAAIRLHPNDTAVGYRNHVRIVREVTVKPDSRFESTNEANELVIEGVLNYQACDESMCYLPQHIPVLWVLHLDEGKRH